MSSDLQWLLLRKNNSYMVKRVREGPVFSKEQGNPLNLHSFKYSGLANSKTIHVHDSGSGVHITTRKPSSASSHVKGARHTTSIRSGSGTRRSLRVASGPSKKGYRPDLRRAVLARAAALIAAQKEPKPTPEKKIRGKKAKTA
ncbi:ribosomal protein L28e [Rickenella mellea]|uniref:Ribosomal protein L28e n=1 Tax=Rickenella mellea TaxID=50990 RepID=A0A4Y7QHR8_9AGAM|nr:ribosomal protein L28e [Rickenella mellea]